jgi:hypothetical protein
MRVVTPRFANIRQSYPAISRTETSNRSSILRRSVTAATYMVPAPMHQGADRYRAPCTPTGEVLASIYAEVLAQPVVPKSVR